MIIKDPKSAAQHAEAAAMELSKGNPAHAETLSQLVLQFGPSAVALNVLGKLAVEVGRADLALEWLRHAVSVDPRFKPAQKNLAAAERLAESQRTTPPPDLQPGGPPRYLLIRGWGYGFWADVDHVMGSLLLAEFTNRIPVVHWGPESLWTDRGHEGWSHYFEPVSPATITDFEAAATGPIFPPKWTPANLRAAPPDRWEGSWSRMAGFRFFNRPERVAVSDFHSAIVSLLAWAPAGHPLKGRGFRDAHRDLFARYLRVRPDIVALANTFVREHLPSPEHAVAVHIRGTDKVVESPHLVSMHVEYEKRLDALIDQNRDLKIFLMTDDRSVRDRMETRYGDRIVCTDAARSAGFTGVHYQEHASRAQLGIDVLRDVLVASRCGRLIGLGSSNVTLAALHMKDWPEQRVDLLDVPIHAYPSPMLHARR